MAMGGGGEGGNVLGPPLVTMTTSPIYGIYQRNHTLTCDDSGNCDGGGSDVRGVPSANVAPHVWEGVGMEGGGAVGGGGADPLSSHRTT